MNSTLATADHASFQAHLKSWFAANAPAKGSAGDFSAAHIVSASSIEEFTAREHAAMETTRRWQRRLYDAGLAGCSWPTEYGGAGGAQWQEEAVVEEQALWGVSTKMLSIALEMVPPVLFAHGTHEQRLTHLPRVIRGEESWCQLLSEPDAGSDLGSVTTLATRVDGGWSVSGQKVWTSGAGSSDFALLIARFDRNVTGRAGLTCFALKMDQPEIEVRPLRQMSGSYHFNEVFIDGAFVPDAGLIGELGGGFRVLRTMLSSERKAIGGGTSARSAVQLVAMAQQLGRCHAPVDRQRLAMTVGRERLLDLLVSRIAAGAAVPSAGSVVKLLYSEHARRSADLAMSLLGPRGLSVDEVTEPWLERLLFAPGLRLGGGTDEIQRNTIGEQGLGLPREPR